MERIPPAQRNSVIDILNQPKATSSQKKNMLLKKGLLRSTVDELEVLADIGPSSSAPSPYSD